MTEHRPWISHYSVLFTLYSLLFTLLTQKIHGQGQETLSYPFVFDSIPFIHVLVVLGLQSELVLGLLLGQGLKYLLKLRAAGALDQVIVKI